MGSLTNNITLENHQKTTVNVRNLPDAVHRAQAAHHGRSTEAETRLILEEATRPTERVKLGSLLTSIAREAGGLTAAEAQAFNRDKTPTKHPT